MIFGNSYTSYAKNTSIHLHIAKGLESIISGKAVEVVVLHDNDPTEYKIPMSTNNNKMYTASDNGDYVTTKISYFLIGGAVYTYGPTGEVVPGTEGGGTINCDLVKLPDVTLTYDANGADTGAPPAPQTMKIYSSFIVSGNTGNLAKTGHIFTGWNTAADGSGENYAIGSSSSIGIQNLTLFAQWKPVYPVVYHANPVDGFTLSGSVPTDSNLYQVAQDVTVKDKGTLQLANHSFAGWTLSSTGEGSTYVAGNKVAMDEGGLKFYAKWTMNSKYNVSYDGNGNTDGLVPSGGSYFAGETVSVSGNTGGLEKTGFTFNGWNTAANGMGTQYGVGSSFTMEVNNVVLFAQWKPDQVEPSKFSVIYDSNGGTGTVPIDEGIYEQGEIVTVKDSDLSRTDYRFMGWSEDPADTEPEYKSTETFSMPAGNVTLYAVWAPLFTVTYVPNFEGGTAPVDINEYIKGEEVTVMAKMIRSHYEFINWNTSVNGDGTPYDADEVFEMGNANVTLYAQWKENDKFVVTYNGNGATGGTVPVDGDSYYKDQSTSVLGNTGLLTRPGFDFVGWNTAANGTGTSYDEDDTLTFTSGSIELYAMWQLIPDENPPQPTQPSSEEPPTPEPTTAAPTEQIDDEPVAQGAAIEQVDVDQFLVEPTFEEVVEVDVEDIPLGPSTLPQTGQLPAELFYGIGGLITAAGAFMKRKK